MDPNPRLQYKAQASIDPKYAPVIQRGKFLHEQPSRSSFPKKRKASKIHIDLWLDGLIYPFDPRPGKHPRFNCLKGLLEFVGDGNNELFGYVQSLCSESVRLEYIQQVAKLREEVWKLQQ